MVERKARGMQRKSRQTKFIPISSIQRSFAVIRVADQRVMNMLHVPAYLMKSSRMRKCLHERYVHARP